MMRFVDCNNEPRSIDGTGCQLASVGGRWLLESSMVGYAALDVGGKLKAQQQCTQRKLDDGDWPGHLVINTVPQNGDVRLLAGKYT